MDFLNKSFAQLKDLLESMTPGARITAGLLLVVVVVSLGYLFTQELGGSGTYLMEGEVFSPRDLPLMQAAFAKAGLSGHEVENGRIRVPRGQQSAYMAALAEANALPHNFGDILQKALESGSVFEDRQLRQQRTQIAMQKEVALMLSAMDGIENAAVFYATETKRGFRSQPRTTASVSIQPEGSQPLEPSVVPSIRYAVAMAFPGLKAENVAVMDLNGRRTYYGNSEGVGSPLDDPYVTRTQFWEQHYKEKILDSLSRVQGVTVNCTVELDPERIRREEQVKHDPKGSVPYQVTDTTSSRSSQAGGPGGNVGLTAQVMNTPRSLNTTGPQGTTEEEEQSERQEISAVASTRTETETGGHTLQRVTVAVGVPESYFEKVWRERNPPEPGAEPQDPDQTELSQIRAEEIANIQSCVAALIPLPTGVTDPTELVAVNVFPDFKVERLPLPGIGEKALGWFARYWGTLGLIGLAIFSLWMLRSIAKAVPEPAGSGAAATILANEQTADVETEQTPDEGSRRTFNTSGGSLRNELSELVNSDPEAAASILRTWIGSAT